MYLYPDWQSLNQQKKVENCIRDQINEFGDKPFDETSRCFCSSDKVIRYGLFKWLLGCERGDTLEVASEALTDPLDWDCTLETAVTRLDCVKTVISFSKLKCHSCSWQRCLRFPSGKQTESSQASRHTRRSRTTSSILWASWFRREEIWRRSTWQESKKKGQQSADDMTVFYQKSKSAFLSKE